MSLTTNWRVQTGAVDNYICSRSGSDSNTGTEGSPYLTVQNNWSGTKYIRGQFQCTSNVGTASIFGDGFAYINFQGNSFTSIANSRNSIRDIFIDNVVHTNSSNASNFGTRFLGCTIRNSSIQIRRTSTGLNEFDTVINTNVFITNASTSGFVNSGVKKSTFIGCLNYDVIQNEYCAFSGCTITANTKSDTRTFDNCAFSDDTIWKSGDLFTSLTLNGDADTIGNTYASNERFSGTLVNGGRTFVLTNCFYSNNLGFIGESINALSITPASPLVNGNAIIGSKPVGILLNAQSAPFTDAGASYTNVTPTGTKFILDVGQTEGTVTSTDNLSTCITLPFATTVSEMVQAFGTFLYSQGEWIDKENYDPATNPEVRLTWEIAALDENTLLWGPFINYEVNTALEVDNSGLGNGNVNASMPDLGAITAKRFRIRFTIRTNGV